MSMENISDIEFSDENRMAITIYIRGLKNKYPEFEDKIETYYFQCLREIINKNDESFDDTDLSRAEEMCSRRIQSGYYKDEK